MIISPLFLRQRISFDEIVNILEVGTIEHEARAFQGRRPLFSILVARPSELTRSDKLSSKFLT